MTRQAIVMTGAVFVVLAGPMATPAAAQKCAVPKVEKNCLQYTCTKRGLCGGPRVFTTNGCLRYICTKMYVPKIRPPRQG